MENKRVVSFDIARAICIIYIVGCWHMIEYTNHANLIDSKLSAITMIVLSCFTLVSGLFISHKYQSCREFYHKRFNRFYLLFFIASLLFLLVGYEEPIQFVLSLLGLSNFIPPQPYTLWYICMLMIFYMITPFLLSPKIAVGKSPRISVIIKCLITIAVFYGLDFLGCVDSRLPFYFVFYAVGIVTPFQKLKVIMYEYALCVPTLIILIIAICLGGAFLYNIFVIAVGVLFILLASRIIELMSGKLIVRLFTYLSYASMCAYLFHRIVYKLIVKVIANDSGYVDEYWAPFMILILFIISYYIQLGYDKYVVVYLKTRK